MINLDICPPAAVLIADVAKARRKRARTALLQQHRTIQDLYCKENCTSRSSNFIRRPAAVIQGSDTLFGQTLLTDSPTLALTFSAFTLTLCLPWLINTYRGHQQSDEQQDSEHERKNDGKRASGSGHETADSKSFKGKGENEPQSIAEVWAAAWAPFIVLEGNATDCKGGVEQPIGDDAQAMALSTPLLYIQGLQSSSRENLLKNSLAALQWQVNNVAYDAGMLLDESLWPTLCLTMLESASIEAAELWLGYVPLELRKVIAERKKADPVDKTPSQPGLDEGAEAEPAVGWFAIKERMSIYCSTLRLLRSSQVQMPEQLTCQPSSSIKGWQATLRGQRSTSQLVRFAPDVLHDMTVRIADLVASAYLQEAANGKWSMLGSSNATSDVSSSNDKQLANPRLFSLEPSWWASYAHPRLSSTRQLQRFLNRISLFRWLYNNVTGVAAMMEDRLPLFILSRVKTGPALRVFDLPIRRSQELSTLAGLRYAVSLMMEAMDIIAPLTVILWTKASQVVTWVLVHWLGKGIGLLWQGIRAGVRSNSMSSKKKAQKRTKQGDLRWGILW